jgi:hypothetical protein
MKKTAQNDLPIFWSRFWPPNIDVRVACLIQSLSPNTKRRHDETLLQQSTSTLICLYPAWVLVSGSERACKPCPTFTLRMLTSFRFCFSLALEREASHKEHILKIAAAAAGSSVTRFSAHHGTPVLAMHSISREIQTPLS